MTPLEMSHANPTAIQEAVTVLRQGGVVAFPTETVYGLGADASNPDALARLYSIKGRPTRHPVIVHLSHPSELTRWAKDIPAGAEVLAEAFWPGPLTMILKRAEHVLDFITGGQDTIGLRIPNHPVALDLLKAYNGGIAGPSANRFGHISPTTAQHVSDEFPEGLDYILDGGDCQVGLESTIIDMSGESPVILRPGMISAEQLSNALGQPVPLSSVLKQKPEIRVPGQYARHYAPSTPLSIVGTQALLTTIEAHRQQDQSVAVLAHSSRPDNLSDIPWIEAPADPVPYARQLYANLRQLDRLSTHRILVEQTADTPDWQAILDRLTRAAH